MFRHRVVGEAGQELFCDNDLKRELLQLGGGFAQFYGPAGSALAPPLAETEGGILFADLDFDMIDIAKQAYDPVGHYSRPDVFQLLFEPRKNQRISVFSTSDPLVRESVTDQVTPGEGETD